MVKKLLSEIYQQKLVGDSFFELLSRHFVCTGVGYGSKLFVKSMYDFQAENTETLLDLVENRPKDRALITVCNHTSTLDEPGLWAMLPLRIFANLQRMRWSLAAEDVCFTTAATRWFFGSGHGISVRRGAGLQQLGVELSVQKLVEGKWLHLFPEGKVHQNAQLNFMKWGVAKMAAASTLRSPHKKAPIVLPFYHTGMERVVPLSRFDNSVGYPSLCWPGKIKIRVRVGQPFYVDEIVHGFVEEQERKREKGVAYPPHFSQDTPEEKQFYSRLTEEIAVKLRALEHVMESQRAVSYTHSEPTRRS